MRTGVRTGPNPYDITSGSDDSLWFTPTPASAAAADEDMLGRGDEVDRVLEEASRRGYVGASYVRELKNVLRKTGYIS